MTKEIRIGGKVFREGQIINSDNLGPVGYFYVTESTIPEEERSFLIIEKICPKIVKVGYFCWSPYRQPHQWIVTLRRRIRHEQLKHYTPATKIQMDNHIFYMENYITLYFN